MSKYFEGYYCKDDESIDGIKNKNEREVLRAISNSYPWGISRDEISKYTSIPQETVYNSLKILGRIGYIKKEEKKKLRNRGSRGQRDAFTYYIENRSYALNRAEGFPYQFAPGHTRYSSSLEDSWQKLVEKDLQDNIYTLLLNLLRRVFTIIDGSNDNVIKAIVPRIESTKDGKTIKMHCRYCGINHEARDFIHAILLYLIDQFEITPALIEFLDSQKLGKEKRSAFFKFFKSQPEASEIDEMIKLKSIADQEGITDHLDDAKDVISVDYKNMVELLLKQRPEISAEQIREMIDEKKRKVGAGYLTDHGALFLIAVDLGISFENVPKYLSSAIEDLYIGVKEAAAITARVRNIYPIRRFIKKDTHEEIVNRIMTIHDKESSIKVRLDNSQVNIPDEMNLQPEDLITISGCHFEADLNGELIISLDSNGSIELCDRNDND